MCNGRSGVGDRGLRVEPFAVERGDDDVDVFQDAGDFQGVEDVDGVDGHAALALGDAGFVAFG